MSDTPATKPRKQEFETVLDGSDRTVAAFEGHEKNVLDRLQHFLHANPTMVPVIVLIASVIAFGFIAGGNFFSAFNLSLIMQQVSIIGILAAAQSLVILTAGIDLSVGAIMVLMSVITGNLAVSLGVPAPLAIGAGMAGGTLAGFMNGLLVKIGRASCRERVSDPV